jgi:hypothetical protein
MKDAFQLAPSTIAVLKKKTRAASLFGMQSHTGLKDVTMADLEENPLVPAHWMSIILAGGKELRVTFKACFMSRDVRILAENTYGDRPMTVEQTSEFLKEFCNLSIGSLKLFLERNKIFLGVSLPIVTRGFDEVFFPVPAGNMSFTDSWRIRANEAVVDCRVIYEIFESFSVTENSKGDATSSGDVVFL